MKHPFFRFVAVCMVAASLHSCHAGGSNKENVADTAVKTTSDTTIIPGTPGPSGTQPGPGDTTRAHRDSLKRAADISDSSGGSATKP